MQDLWTSCETISIFAGAVENEQVFHFSLRTGERLDWKVVSLSLSVMCNKSGPLVQSNCDRIPLCGPSCTRLTVGEGQSN